MAQNKTPTNILRPGEVVAAGGWSGIFGNDHPLNLEIGVGGGEFLLAMAHREPQENFVGLDIAGHFLRKAARAAAREELTNVRFMVSEAKVTMHELFQSESLHAVYINFPDPWPKISHQKRRHFEPRFLSLLEDRLIPEGYLYLATDVEEYAQEAHAALAGSSVLANAYPEAWLHDRGWSGLETRYERKWTEQGKRLYYLAFRKARSLDFPRHEVEWVETAPVELGPAPLARLAELMRATVSVGDKYLFKPLGVRVEDDRVRSKIILIDTERGYRDYLDGIIEGTAEGLRYTIVNPNEWVYTVRKQNLLQRYFDQLLSAA